MRVFTYPECRCCAYREYNQEKADYKHYLDEEPVPNCNRAVCSLNGENITRFINQGWVIKFRKEARI